MLNLIYFLLQGFMCSGSKSKLSPLDMVMEGKSPNQEDQISSKGSVLLELSASDDLSGFRCEVEEKGFDVDTLGLWYGRRIGSKKMGFEERTPLSIAAMFGSIEVLKYIIGNGEADVNKACGSDRVTALHCATAGGSDSSLDAVKLLLDAAADANLADCNGNKPVDVIAPALKSSCNPRRRAMEMLLRGDSQAIELQEEQQQSFTTPLMTSGSEKKEYPIDISLPDINNGIYGTDEFRMFTFKVKPCSRAYSHDWTECPFVHPGENARRRDPKKYPYSCVPCPEYRKGSCQKGDSCEYAHGVFECWLHPAQYRTRLCKDETGCSRKVCFFAHKHEELRPLYASTGSAIPSPRSLSASAVDMAATLSPLTLSSSSAMLLPPTSTPPMSPSVVSSSPKSSGMWQNKISLTPPSLQLPGSRLKSALSARDLELELELLELENQLTQKQLMDEMSGLSSPSCWNKEFSTNLDDMLVSLDPSLLSQLQGLSMKSSTPQLQSPQLQSPTGIQMRQNMNQMRSSYPSKTTVSSSPVRKTPSMPSYGFDSSAAVAAAVMNSRSSAFAKRSQSFIDRGGVSHRPPGFTASSSNSSTLMSSNHSDWSSPDGKLDWGFQGDELNKLKKSASFGFRTNNTATSTTPMMIPSTDEPDVSWVNSLVKDVPSVSSGLFGSQKQSYGAGFHQNLPPWVEQMYIEQEQMVA